MVDTAPPRLVQLHRTLNTGDPAAAGPLPKVIRESRTLVEVFLELGKVAVQERRTVQATTGRAGRTW